MSNDLLVGRVLNLPAVLAKKYAVHPSMLDELESAGNLALVRAARSYQADRGASFSTWAYKNVNSRIKRLAARLLNAGLTPQESSPRADHADPALLAELADESAIGNWAIAGLSPVDRLVYLWRHRDGLRYREISERLGGVIGGQGVKDRIDSIQKRLRLRLSRKNHARWLPKSGGKPPRSKRRQEAAAKALTERAIAAKLAGKIPQHAKAWYLADDEAKTLHGPERSLAALLAVAGIDLNKEEGKAFGKKITRIVRELSGSARLGGRRIVKGTDARSLAESGYRLAIDTTEIRRKRTS